LARRCHDLQQKRAQRRPALGGHLRPVDDRPWHLFRWVVFVRLAKGAIDDRVAGDGVDSVIVAISSLSRSIARGDASRAMRVTSP